jgi:hypothetical protein
MLPIKKTKKLSWPVYSFFTLKKLHWRIPEILLSQECVLCSLSENERKRYVETRQTGGVQGGVFPLPMPLSTETLLHIWEDRPFHPGHPAEFLAFLSQYGNHISTPIGAMRTNALFRNEEGIQCILAFRMEHENKRDIPTLFLEPFQQYKWEEGWNFF